MGFVAARAGLSMSRWRPKGPVSMLYHGTLMFSGFYMGIVSYSQTCMRRMLELEDSPMADQLRDFMTRADSGAQSHRQGREQEQDDGQDKRRDREQEQQDERTQARRERQERRAAQEESGYTKTPDTQPPRRPSRPDQGSSWGSQKKTAPPVENDIWDAEPAQAPATGGDGEVEAFPSARPAVVRPRTYEEIRAEHRRQAKAGAGRQGGSAQEAGGPSQGSASGQHKAPGWDAIDQRSPRLNKYGDEVAVADD